MKKIDIKTPYGATELSDESKNGLIPQYISKHSELNDLEQSNIQDAILWVEKQKIINVLNQGFLYELHKRMFGDVWQWAGKSRTTDTNIGVDWHQIANNLAQLIRDTEHSIHSKAFSEDEIAARFHHRLVQIHCFVNGNGRHARLATDILVEHHLKIMPLTWGKNTENQRERYISALKAADGHDYSALLIFLRS